MCRLQKGNVQAANGQCAGCGLLTKGGCWEKGMYLIRSCMGACMGVLLSPILEISNFPTLGVPKHFYLHNNVGQIWLAKFQEHFVKGELIRLAIGQWQRQRTESFHPLLGQHA